MKKFYFIAIFILSIKLSNAASFDCSKATTEFEKTICSNQEISVLDDKLTATYKKVLLINPEIKNNQREWLKKTSHCDKNTYVDCVKNAYTDRLSELSSQLDKPTISSKSQVQPKENSTTESIQTQQLPEVESDQKNTISSIKEPVSSEAKNNNSSSNLISEFRAEWCKDVDTATKGKYVYKDIAPGDFCLVPESVLLKFLNITPYPYPSKLLMLDFLKTIDKDRGFTLLPAWFEAMSNNDYQFTAATIDVIKKKIYLSSFSIGVCPQDVANSLAVGNSFRTSLEKKYGKVDSSLSVYDKTQNDLNSLRNEQKNKKIITVKEAKDARDFKSDMEVASNAMESLIPKDQIFTIQWYAVDDIPGLTIEAVDNSRLNGCSSEKFFKFHFSPSTKFIELVINQAKSNADLEKKHEATADVPKF